MHRASNHFARSLEAKQAESTNLHVRGSDSIFSLYAFDNFFLAFYSAVPITSTIDLVRVDAEIEQRVQELGLLVKHLQGRDGSINKKNLMNKVKVAKT